MTTESNIHRWRCEIERLNSFVEPIAKQGVDIFAPDLAARIKAQKNQGVSTSDPKIPMNPLDLAGIREEATNLLHEIAHAYETDDDVLRIAIRKLFKEAPSFRWAATLPIKPMMKSTFYTWLILFSIKDQEEDSRDALLELQSLVSQARRIGIDVDPILESVARLSSTEDVHGMGSTRSIIEGQIRGPR